MIEGYTLPKIVEQLEIHIITAFYWRHKILNALRSLGNSQLNGIIESDEAHSWNRRKVAKAAFHTVMLVNVVVK